MNHRLSKELEEKKGDMGQLVVERVYLDGFELNDTLVVSARFKQVGNVLKDNQLLDVHLATSSSKKQRSGETTPMFKEPKSEKKANKAKEAGSEKKPKVSENISENKAEDGSNLAKRKPEVPIAAGPTALANTKEEAPKPLAESKLSESVTEPAVKKKEKKKEKEGKVPELRSVEEKGFKEDSLVS